MYTTKLKAGKAEDVYFGKGTYNAIGDPFKMAGMMSMRTMVKDGYLKAGHDKDFKPAKNVGYKAHKAIYEYKPLEEGKPQNKKYRNEDGEVITMPSNMKCSPIKKGKVGKNVTLGGIIPAVACEFGIEKQVAAKERQFHYD